MRRFSLLLTLVAGLVTQISIMNAADKKPLTFDDLMRVQRIADPQISPDGKWIAYTVTAVDKEKNSKDSDIWILPIAGGEPRQLTHSPKSDTRPRWSPDSRQIAFVSTRDGSSQVYLLPPDGGEPQKVTQIATEADGVLFSPDGKNLLFYSEVYPECDSGDAQKALDCNAARKKAAENSKVKAHIATRLLFRHWNSWKEGKRSHLFVVPANGSRPPRDLTPGDYDTPPFSLGGPDNYAFSPDGTEVCFASNHDAQEERSTNVDLFTVNLLTGETRKITTNPAYDGSPLYSPNGKFIAYRAQFRAGYESDRFRLMLYDRATGQHRNLSESFDRWIDSFAWAPDNRKLCFIAEDSGRSSIFEISVEGKEVRCLVKENSSGDLGVAPDGRTLVFTRSSMHQPAEIYTAASNGSGPVARTHHNDALLATLRHESSRGILVRRSPFKLKNPQNPHVDSEAAAVRFFKKISGSPAGPRRAAGSLGRRLGISMEPANVCGRRVRRGHAQSARIDRVWPAVDRRNQQGLGRPVFQGPDAGNGRR